MLWPGVPLGELVRPGADRIANELDRRLRRHDRDERQKQRQDRLRRLGGDVDGVVVDHVEGELGVSEVARCLAGELVARRPLERVLDVVRVEGGAVREGHALAQVEPPGAVALILPRFRQARQHALAALHVVLGQRLVDVLHDDPADVRPGRHAGLDEVDVLAEHDGDIARVLGERRRQWQSRERRSEKQGCSDHQVPPWREQFSSIPLRLQRAARHSLASDTNSACQ